MRPHRIIEGASFGPEVMSVVRQAFDAAWDEMACRFGPDMHDEARDHLAEVVMNMARDDSTDVGMIREAALRAMEHHYPMHFGGAQAGQVSKEG